MNFIQPIRSQTNQLPQAINQFNQYLTHGEKPTRINSYNAVGSILLQRTVHRRS